MPKQEGQKSKLLALLHIFEQQTDEEHLLNVPQLVELLARQGILCERKSVYSDIDALNALGYDIRLRRGRSGGYWMATRPFELAELKLLVDAVQSSRVISKASSDKLIHKLEGLASQYEGSQLQRQVYVDGRPKSANKDLPYSVDALFTAINTGRMVRFRYKKAGRPAPYTISPWQMAWENGCYYLIAYNEKHDSFPSYRVDRMQGLRITDEAAVRNERIATFDAAAYTSRTFSMFGGETTPATLLVEESVMSAIIDRFGKDVESAPVDATHARVHVTVAASPVFFGWLAQFGTAVRLEAPSALSRQYADYLRGIADSY